MKRLAALTAAVAFSMFSAAALASDAATSASAGSTRGQRNGTAAATASYQGDVGFARTQSRSGSVNTARGVAVGVDANGLTLSISRALATRTGSAVATNFNLSIGRDGRVSGSTGIALARGPLRSSASAGGQASTDGRNATAISQASGKSDAFGQASASTRSFSTKARTQPVPIKRSRVNLIRIPHKH